MVYDISVVTTPRTVGALAADTRIETAREKRPRLTHSRA